MSDRIEKTELSSLDKGGVRKRSVGSIEIRTGDGMRRVSLDHLPDADRQLAEKFGYNPVLKREFGWLSSFSFALSISSFYATITTTFQVPLDAGGSAGVVWAWFISGFGCMCIACSVAEIVSAYPTCGGLYYTISRLAPRKWVPSICWLDGWLNLLGQAAGVASSVYTGAQMLLAIVSISSDFSYIPDTNATIGVMVALSVFNGLVNSLSTRWLERYTQTYAIFHIASFIACSVALLVKTKDKNDASYVFTHLESNTGWTPVGWSFMFGFLSVSWSMTDYDATAHITEEINEPEIKAPWAISSAMLFAYIFGGLFNIVLCFCMGDPATIINSPVGLPVAQIYYNSLGKTGSIVFTALAFVVMENGTFSATQSLSRTVFAFSRDRLLPGSSWWTKINPITGTPLNAVWMSIFWCTAINLIGLGSYTAILGVFNVCAIALDWSFCIPIFCKLVFGKFEPGPWRMGKKVGQVVNIWAITWTAFVSVIFICPEVIPVTAVTMNWAIAYLVGIIVVCTFWWYISGHNYYTGPIFQADIAENDESPSSSEKKKSDKPKKKK